MSALPRPRVLFCSRRRLAPLAALSLLALLAMIVLAGRSLAAPVRPAWSLFPSQPAGSSSLSFISDVYEEISPAVVGIAAVDADATAGELQVGTGSGLIFDPAGYIITNYHVVAGADALTVSLADGRSAEAEIVGSEPAGDLALLRISLPDLPAAPLGDSAKLRVGEVVFPIGNPGGEQFARSMTMGLISGVDRQMLLADGNLYTLLQTDAAINPGNSGGPLVDCQGNVVGINSAKIVDADFEGMGFAIPIDTVKAFIGELLPE